MAGRGAASGLQALSLVVRAKGGAPDSYNSAGVTRVNVSATGSVEVLTFRSHPAGPYCYGRSLEGYAGTQYGATATANFSSGECGRARVRIRGSG